MIKFVYNLLYMLPFCMVSLIFCSPYLKIKELSFSYILLAVLVLVISELYEVLKAKGRVILTGVVLALLLAVVLILTTGDFPEIYDDKFEYLLVIVISLVSFGISELIINFRLIRLAGCGGMLLSLIITMIFTSSISKAGTYCVFFLSILSVLEEIQLHWKKSGYTDAKKHLVSTAPFILVLFLMFSALPVSSKPYEWKFVKQIIADIKESVNTIKHKIALLRGDDYFVSKIGFSDRGEIGEGVEDEPDDMLEVTVSDVREEAVYLSGKVFDSFVDGEWLNTNESKLNDRMLDTFETRCAVSRFSEHIDDIMRSQHINIKYIDMLTGYMFIPDKIYWGLAGVDDYGAYSFGNSMLFSEKKGYQNEYYLQYFSLNRDSKAFEHFLKSDTAFDKDYWDESLGRFRFTEPGISDYEKLLEHRKNIYDYYLPKTQVSEEMRDVLDRLFEDCEDDIDRLTRIEALLQSFEYSDMPGGLNIDPINEENFLDYFVLHSQRGYCTYFATAFVLLARAEGIPARYVQGYYIPVGKEMQITVTSDMAHAWPEVYIEGKGWLIYEPTPGYKYLSSWMTYDERQGEWKDFDNSYIKDLYEHDFTVLKEEIPVEEDNAGVVIRWYVIVLPVALLITVLVLLYIFEKVILKMKKRKMGIKELIFMNCRKNLDILRLIVRRRLENETLSEYYSEVRDSLLSGFQKEEDTAIDEEAVSDVYSALAFIKAYERVLYSDAELTAGAAEELLHLTEHSIILLENMLRNKSRIKYLGYYVTRRNLG